jgi:dynein heavy chain
MIAINERIKDKNPFIVVALQECERMNGLLAEIKGSLEDLLMGLSGALNMTEQMEKLGQSLEFNRVPGNWEEKAYFSKKGLVVWF